MNELALLARDDDWIGYIWFLVFIVLPVLARGIKALLKRFGVSTDEAGTPRRSVREARTEWRRVEAEGKDLWRRLASGEVAEAPPPPRTSVPRPQENPARSLEGRTLEETSLERGSLEEGPREGGEPAPLAVLGEVLEPGSTPETSLETETAPVPLSAFSSVATEASGRVRRAPTRWSHLSRRELRRAIVLSEALGRPVSERDAG